EVRQAVSRAGRLARPAHPACSAIPPVPCPAHPAPIFRTPAYGVLRYSGVRHIIARMDATGSIREAKKGSAEIVVLTLLEDQPRHGYELARLIDERSGGALTFNFASLYATLYKLEERKWIQGKWVEKPGHRRRRYYQVTARGREVLAAQRKEWAQFLELM